MSVGRFGHHPDPAIDFCVEVDHLTALHFDACNEMADWEVTKERIAFAMEFNVGGDLHAIQAKDSLRRLEQSMLATT